MAKELNNTYSFSKSSSNDQFKEIKKLPQLYVKSDRFLLGKDEDRTHIKKMMQQNNQLTKEEIFKRLKNDAVKLDRRMKNFEMQK